MLKQLKFILALLLCPVLGFSQTNKDEDYANDNVLRYDDYIYKPYIHTVKFYESSWEYNPPLISLFGNDQLLLSFDDLEGESKQYAVSFVHCNADWTPSSLMTTEYIDGFQELSVLNFSFSLNTYQKYTHYELMFPQPGTQQNTRFTKSGNYLLKMYLNGDPENVVLTRRFMVFDTKASIGTVFRPVMGGGDQFKKQHFDFTITGVNYEINNPYKDMNVVLVQNNRWDNAITDIKPTFLGNNEFTYSLDDASTFNGGNEFRYFDVRSTRFLTERVKEILRDNDLKYQVYLQNDEIRSTKPYLFYNDINGNFLTKNRESFGNDNIEADYVYVHFFLPYNLPEGKGNFYIMGKLTDWRMNKLSKLTYNETRGGYETTLYLKQGYYNYIYVLSNDTRKGGDESVTEGSYYDTENDYCIYVYHRKFGTYYDQLIGIKRINSLKR